MADICLEVALNGGLGRTWQPGMPTSVDAIVADALACLDAGASVIHYHAYDEATGAHDERAIDVHRAVLERLRERTDAIVYGTTFTRRGDAPAPSLQERFRIERTLRDEGLVDVFVLDPGSCSFARESNLAGGFAYVNEPRETLAGVELARDSAMVPALAIYELGFARAACAAARAAGLDPRRMAFRLMFTDGFVWGLPPSPETLRLTHAAMAHLGVDRWMLAGIDFDVFALIDEALALGCDIRVGLEDAPRGTEQTNAAMVARAAQRIAAAGHGVLTPAAARARIVG
ncbi:3-keto-5-aminohexanoate cleavage protein [Acuticoccus sp. I52.16.1]|uniref:3-keto-5-aminohexanoate cleavage protein n=1 Tax=Acuticoccus sp. I52.16.1 TaxID=2928472 RepID=UPI001FD468F1|nr:3-keto-5-aminohexanoate cleavage protein [Acuticoccus sp. I52.16.1]UOM32568.1 3-keto-5-aminohexanoate cleavage protein [Acuticoccus sp. I52.16.1]